MPITLQIRPQTKTIDDLQYVLIPLAGHLDDESLPEFELMIEPLLQGQHAYLVFDLGNLSFLNTRTIGYLATIHNRSKAAEKSVAFVNSNEIIFDILEMAGLNDLVPTFDEETTFVKAILDQTLNKCAV
jgi:anti-anti-sigma factor